MSQELEQVQFKLTLSSKWFRLPPHVKVWIDGDLIEDLEIYEKNEIKEKRLVEFTCDLADGEHELRIQYLNKEFPDTRVDEEGNILDDTLITIEEVEIDEIELGYLAYSQGIFHPDRNIHAHLDETIDHMTTIGFNGVWVLKFQVPTYIWFLEHL